MRKLIKTVTATAAISLVVGASLALPGIASAATSMETGKKVSFDRRKGNCLACHVIEDGASPGNIGPPLVAMKARYPDRAKLRAQIYDATAANPQSLMPPFGKHGVLSADELEAVVDYIHSL